MVEDEGLVVVDIVAGAAATVGAHHTGLVLDGAGYEQVLPSVGARLAISLAVRQTVGVVAHVLRAPVVSRGRG